MDYAKMRTGAVPVENLMHAMEGDWQSRNGGTPIREAEVIIGVDKVRDGHAVFFGRELLQRTIDRAPFLTPQAEVLTVKLDFDSPELEFLCAAVQAVKGHHDYGR